MFIVKVLARQRLSRLTQALRDIAKENLKGVVLIRGCHDLGLIFQHAFSVHRSDARTKCRPTRNFKGGVVGLLSKLFQQF